MATPNGGEAQNVIIVSGTPNGGEPQNVYVSNAGGIFVYRAGVAGSTFANALAAAQAAGPGSTVIVDDSQGSPVLPAGTYDISNINIDGGYGGLTQINVDNGVVLTVTKGTRFRNIDLVFSNSAPVIEVGSDPTYIIFDDSARFDATGSAPVIHCANGAGDLTITLKFQSSLAGNTGKPVLSVDAGAYASILANTGTLIASNTVYGDGAITLADYTTGITGLGAAGISHTQTGATNITYA